MASFFILQLAVPSLIEAVYVRPNEISIERPYIERHIEATIGAFGLDRNSVGKPFVPSATATVDPVQDATLLDNVRLWDLRAYNATITQIQALRPYYTFPETDVDRYFPDGQIKQVLLSPRELDVSQLSAEASQSWINPRFIYTHGFGVVVSEVNKITPDGLPVLLIENAPPEIKVAGIPAHAAGDLLRREDAGSGVRSYGARGIRLSVRRPEQVFDLPGPGRISRWIFPDESCRRDFPGRAEYRFHQLSDRREPHDDLPQGAGAAANIWRDSCTGIRTPTW